MTDINSTTVGWLNSILQESLDGQDGQGQAVAKGVEKLVSQGNLVYFRYPVKPKPRYGWGLPAHRLFEEKIVSDTPTIQRRLSRYAELALVLGGVVRDKPNPDQGTPFWQNVLLPVIDAVSICGMIGEFSPRQFIEIGSGNSTRFARLATAALGVRCEIVSIDAFPEDTISATPDRLIAQPLEEVDLTIFDSLQAGDIVWMDGSHRAFSNTDVSVFCFDVLPRLAPGVIIGVHDITLPWDYPPQWDQYYFSENFVVGSYLLGAIHRVEFLFPALYINHIAPDLRAILAPIWKLPALSPPLDELGGGGAFWFRFPKYSL